MNNKVSTKIKDKLLKDLEQEQLLIEQCKVKKASQDTIDQSVKRLYNEAERRKVTREVKLKERGLLEESEDRDNTPSKYKKHKESAANYNFLVSIGV
jgi:hypothetical protein